MLMLGERPESQRKVVAINVVPDSWAEQSPSCSEHCSLYGPTLSGHQPAEPWFFSGPSSNASQFLRPRFSPEKEAQLVFSFFSWHLISCSILWRGLLWLSAVSTFFFTEYEWEVKWKHHNRMIKVPRKRREKLTKKTPVFVISLYKILFWFRRFYSDTKRPVNGVITWSCADRSFDSSSLFSFSTFCFSVYSSSSWTSICLSCNNIQAK